MADEKTSPDQLEADIERQRDALAETVNALQAKLDVKTRSRDKAAELKARATTDSGRPRLEVLAAAAGLVVAFAFVVWQRRR